MERVNIVKMTVYTKLIYKFNAILHQFLMVHVCVYVNVKKNGSIVQMEE